MTRERKIINLALQGGGTYGALEWGILDKLLEDGRVQFDAISATSSGAMNAAVLVHGLLEGGNDAAREALYQFWKKISDIGKLINPIQFTPFEQLLGVQIENSMSYFLFNSMISLLSPYQFNPLNLNPLKDILEELVDFDKIRSSKRVKMFVSATNVKTGKMKLFDNKNLSSDALMASACLPYLFQAVEVDEEFFWDGGYMGNPAIFPLIYNSDCPDVLIVHVHPVNRENVPNTAVEILNRISEISFNSSLMREMRAIRFVTKLIQDGWIKEEFKNNFKTMFMHAIRADIPMQSFSRASRLNPDWDFIKLLYEKGREEATNWLKNDYKHIGIKTSIDMEQYL